ncbi:hypothetical protein NQZ79_g7847 [Umbelopsis isabellina]|nr:hypothetical protein NQZ79_g7847 [Umbelopsis isabellina]
MTIFILPTRLKLLHFQKHQLPLVAHALIKACLLSDTSDPAYFFSYTENSYEISIVASVETIENDFLPLLNSVASSTIQVSQDVFRVLQVDDEGGQDCSGKRISDLSAPLAKAQFSIFYMSTYQTDFVLIKDIKLREAVLSLMHHGFEFDQESVDEELGDLEVLKQPPSIATDTRVIPEDEQYAADLSPTWEQTVLDNELRCVGLNKHADVASWSMAILKILLYPDMIDGYRDTTTPRFFSYTSTCEGVSLLTEQYIIDSFDENIICGTEDETPLRVVQINLSDSNLDRCGIVRSISHPLATAAQINILYLSTYTTANILVSAGDLEQALSVMSFTRRVEDTEPYLEEPSVDQPAAPLSELIST